MNIETRMAAEGYTFKLLMDAIVAASKSKAMKYELPLFSNGTTEYLADSISSSEEYRGGYMYRYDYVVATPPTQFQHRVHYVNNYDHSDPETFFEYNLTALAAMPVGGTVKLCIEHPNNSGGIDSTTWEKLPEGGWRNTARVDDMVQTDKELAICGMRLWLYEGIREDVAKALGVNTSTTFHKAFDEMVIELESQN